MGQRRETERKRLILAWEKPIGEERRRMFKLFPEEKTLARDCHCHQDDDPAAPRAENISAGHR